MGYNLTYGPARRKTNRQRAKLRQLGMAALFFGLFCALAHRIWADELQLLADLWLPRAAIGALLSDLQAGESISHAVGAFCESVMDGR